MLKNGFPFVKNHTSLPHHPTRHLEFLVGGGRILCSQWIDVILNESYYTFIVFNVLKTKRVSISYVCFIIFCIVKKDLCYNFA